MRVVRAIALALGLILLAVAIITGKDGHRVSPGVEIASNGMSVIVLWSANPDSHIAWDDLPGLPRLILGNDFAFLELPLWLALTVVAVFSAVVRTLRPPQLPAAGEPADYNLRGRHRGERRRRRSGA